MPNAYLVECHRYITRELDRAQALKSRAESRGDTRQIAYLNGQIEEFCALRQYMAENFNLNTQRYF